MEAAANLVGRCAARTLTVGQARSAYGSLFPLAAPQFAAPRVHPIHAWLPRRPRAAGRAPTDRSAVRRPGGTPVSASRPTTRAPSPRRPHAAAHAPADESAARRLGGAPVSASPPTTPA